MRLLLFLLPCILTAQVVHTADPIKRGFQLIDFPRTVKVTDNVYTYEDFHSGAEKFTTTNMFVVTKEGVLVADAQGSPEATRGLVEAIRKVTSQPIKYLIVCSDHGDHTGGNAALPAGITYYIHPTSKAILEKSTNGWNRSLELCPQLGRCANRNCRYCSRCEEHPSSISIHQTQQRSHILLILNI